jgi:hypothetical protein
MQQWWLFEGQSPPKVPPCGKVLAHLPFCVLTESLELELSRWTVGLHSVQSCLLAFAVMAPIPRDLGESQALSRRPALSTGSPLM